MDYTVCKRCGLGTLFNGDKVIDGILLHEHCWNHWVSKGKIQIYVPGSSEVHTPQEVFQAQIPHEFRPLLHFSHHHGSQPPNQSQPQYGGLRQSQPQKQNGTFDRGIVDREYLPYPYQWLNELPGFNHVVNPSHEVQERFRLVRFGGIINGGRFPFEHRQEPIQEPASHISPAVIALSMALRQEPDPVKKSYIKVSQIPKKRFPVAIKRQNRQNCRRRSHHF